MWLNVLFGDELKNFLCFLSPSSEQKCVSDTAGLYYGVHIPRLRWSRGSVLAFGTQVRGFKPGRSRRIFKGEKILSTPSFGGEVKPSVPCRRFAACKRSLELGGSRNLDKICRNISRPRRVPPSAARGLSRRWTWRHLAGEGGNV